MVLLGTVISNTVQLQAMSTTNSGAASSQSSATSSRITRTQRAATERLKRRTAIKNILTNTESASTSEVISTPRPSPRTIRTKAAAPDAPESRSVRPTVVLEKAGCGDGLLLDAEECDDGNKVSGDGCSAACAIEVGFDCDRYAQPTTCRERCGNGGVSVNETCDDGNANDLDGCSRYCKTEYGFTCTTASPNVCTAVCGNASTNGAEQCDDGNTASGDGCSSTCLSE